MNPFLTPTPILLTVFMLVQNASAQPLPTASPENVGMSAERLARLEPFLDALLDNGTRAGTRVLVARRGKLVGDFTSGYANYEKQTSLEPDTLFRIYSMSKPITAVATLILVEEGKVNLDQAAADFIPELAEVKVLIGGTVDAPLLADLERPITVRHLLTHTSGFTYGSEDENAPVVEQLASRAGFFDAGSLQKAAETLTRYHLKFQPGEEWEYGISQDVLGILIENVSGVSFGEFLRTRVFEPLGMSQTTFRIPASQFADLAAIHTVNDEDRLVIHENKEFHATGENFQVTSVESGGGGLISTGYDYLRFAQMLVNQGELDGARILSRPTVEMMWLNQLARFDDPTVDFNRHEGYGFGGQVPAFPALRPDLTPSVTYGWSGYASTHFTIDKREELVVVMLNAHLPFNERQIFSKVWNLVYAAIDD